MADAVFRADQHARLHEPHIAPVTQFVDERRSSQRWMPYIAPMHGGIDARVLTVLRDPGPKTQDEGGSGMLCVENDDPTAETQLALMTKSGVKPSDILPWNAYPWYINAAPSSTQLAEGSEVLRLLVGLLPRVRVVLLQGGEAQRVWRLVLREEPKLARLETVATYHPSRSALRTPDAVERARRVQHREQSWAAVASLLSVGREAEDE